MRTSFYELLNQQFLSDAACMLLLTLTQFSALCIPGGLKKSYLSVCQPVSLNLLKLSTTLADIHRSNIQKKKCVTLPTSVSKSFTDSRWRQATVHTLSSTLSFFTLHHIFGNDVAKIRIQSTSILAQRRHVKEWLRRSVAGEVLSDGQIVTELLHGVDCVTKIWHFYDPGRRWAPPGSERCQWFSL